MKKEYIFKKYVYGNESNLVNAYMVLGPTRLRKSLGLNKQEWCFVFDYLAKNFGLLMKCVSDNKEFFLDLYVKYGIKHIRDILDVLDVKYDEIFEPVFNFLAIENDGLFLHVLQNRKKYLLALKARGEMFLRGLLGIINEQYNDSWNEIVKILTNSNCGGIFTEKTLENGFKNFMKMYNWGREHRIIIKNDIA